MYIMLIWLYERSHHLFPFLNLNRVPLLDLGSQKEWARYGNEQYYVKIFMAQFLMEEMSRRLIEKDTHNPLTRSFSLTQ